MKFQSSPVPPGIEVPHPGGRDENSSAFERWGRDRAAASPEGTIERAAFQPSLRDLSPTPPTPRVETLGYSRLSLRDRRTGRCETSSGRVLDRPRFAANI